MSESKDVITIQGIQIPVAKLKVLTRPLLNICESINQIVKIQDETIDVAFRAFRNTLQIKDTDPNTINETLNSLKQIIIGVIDNSETIPDDKRNSVRVDVTKRLDTLIEYLNSRNTDVKQYTLQLLQLSPNNVINFDTKLLKEASDRGIDPKFDPSKMAVNPLATAITQAAGQRTQLKSVQKSNVSSSLGSSQKPTTDFRDVLKGQKPKTTQTTTASPGDSKAKQPTEQQPKTEQSKTQSPVPQKHQSKDTKATDRPSISQGPVGPTPGKPILSSADRQALAAKLGAVFSGGAKQPTPTKDKKPGK